MCSKVENKSHVIQAGIFLFMSIYMYCMLYLTFFVRMMVVHAFSCTIAPAALLEFTHMSAHTQSS